MSRSLCVRSLCLAFVFNLGLTLSTVDAAPILIDFDGFASGTNIDGMNLGGVTITSADGTTIASGAHGVGSISPPNSAQNDDFAKTNPLVLTFDGLVSSVTLTGLDVGGDFDKFQLQAFDSMNMLIATFTTPVFGGNSSGIDAYTATITAPGIKRVEFSALINAGLGIDDLQFTEEVPEPASLAFWSILGTAGIAGWRRMRKVASA